MVLNRPGPRIQNQYRPLNQSRTPLNQSLVRPDLERKDPSAICRHQGDWSTGPKRGETSQIHITEMELFDVREQSHVCDLIATAAFKLMCSHSTVRTLGMGGITGGTIEPCNSVVDANPRRRRLSQSWPASESLTFFTTVPNLGVLRSMSSHREKSSAQAKWMEEKRCTMAKACVVLDTSDIARKWPWPVHNVR